MNEPATAAGPKRLPIAALAAGETIVWAAFYYTFPALISRWESDEGWEKTLLTAAFAGTILLSAILAPLAGRLIDRGLGPQLMTGAAAFGAGLLFAVSFTTSLPLFCLFWLALGIPVAGALYEPCFAVLTRALGRRAKPAITAVTLVAGFAGTVAFPLTHWIAEIGGWRLACQTMGGLALFVGLPLLWFGTSRLGAVEEERAEMPPPAAAPATATTATTTTTTTTTTTSVAAPEPAARPQAQAWTPAHRRRFWRLTAGFAIIGGAHGLMLNHLLPILESAHIDEGLAVTAAAGIGPMQVVGRLGMLGVERLVSNRIVTLASCIAVTVGSLCLLGTFAVPVLVVGFVVLHGSGYGTVSIMRPVMLREALGGTNFGAISGRMARVYTGATALSPFLGSLLWLIGGYGLALGLVAGACLVAVVNFATLSNEPVSLVD
ncbi:MFS transporter [Jiella endophytica]|uniref:MFS transporter n=1 Tax=Jiella endophytica TaxID=2558362 RepID=A0A4Y8RF00_9HYPH|nr:MFS transporter [Jiella endophytica]TFF20644.1 MFS transporter [Jiella endophytica]TFF26945.1 MFS transporter [Jiella endophytica]